MPIYEYQCESCGERTEAIQSFDDPPLAVCPHCGGDLKKLMSAPAFQFKGTGWYVTDYAGKGRQGEGRKSDSGGASAEGKTDAASSSSDAAKTSGKSDSSADT